MDFLEGLNPQQCEAVCHSDGPMLILAGAGSGKTRVITHRIAYLVGHKRVPAEAVLAVTFTNKAAEEMRERVPKWMGPHAGASKPWLSTFHSFSVRLLRRDGATLADLRPGFTPRFTIYDEDDQRAVIKAVYRRLGLDEKFMQYRAALSRISNAKSQKQTPADLYKVSADPKISRLALVVKVTAR
ncbi:MAG: UvrD-helicase domain-containing protein, partial [Acidobacteria bacterium]|nr:UvrD-helicase domain-containing protein [Acidobacteriota bacterium]